MINTRQLVRPNPSDANIIPNNNSLGMILNGGTDLSRFFFYAGKYRKINNRTSNPYNHTRSVGGYYSDATIFKNRYLNSVEKGGINPLPPQPSRQYIGNQVTNNPLPVRNALVAAPIYPKVSHLADSRLALPVNPIATR